MRVYCGRLPWGNRDTAPDNDLLPVPSAIAHPAGARHPAISLDLQSALRAGAHVFPHGLREALATKGRRGGTAERAGDPLPRRPMPRLGPSDRMGALVQDRLPHDAFIVEPDQF